MVKTMVVKIGPDWPVRPEQPGANWPDFDQTSKPNGLTLVF